MMYFSKTTADASSAGQIGIRNFQLTAPYQSQARLSVVKTLDGGSSFSHFGVSITDSDNVVECRLSEPEALIIKALHENGTLIRISYWAGAYHGYIDRVNIRRDGLSQLTLKFKERLTS